MGHDGLIASRTGIAAAQPTTTARTQCRRAAERFRISSITANARTITSDILIVLFASRPITLIGRLLSLPWRRVPQSDPGPYRRDGNPRRRGPPQQPARPS